MFLHGPVSGHHRGSDYPLGRSVPLDVEDVKVELAEALGVTKGAEALADLVAGPGSLADDVLYKQ